MGRPKKAESPPLRRENPYARGWSFLAHPVPAPRPAVYGDVTVEEGERCVTPSWTVSDDLRLNELFVKGTT